MMIIQKYHHAGYTFFLKPIFGNKFGKNWSLLTLSKLMCQLFGVLATIRVARILSPQSYGLFSLVQTIASLGLVLAGLGLRQVIIRVGSRHPEQSGSLFRSSLFVLLISGSIINAGILLYGSLITHNFSIVISSIIVGFIFGLLLWEILESIAFANERAQHSAYINFFGSIVWVSFVWFTPENFLTINIVCFSFAVLQCVKSLVFYFFEKKHIHSRVNDNRHSSYELVYESLPFYWLALFSMVTIQLPILFLAKGSGMLEVGFYGAAQKVIDPLNVIVYSGILMLYPTLSKAAFIDPVGFMDRLKYFLFILVLFSSASAMFVSLFKYEITHLLFGDQFAKTAHTLQILAWMPLLTNLFALISCVLSSLKRQKWLVIFSTVHAVISLPIIWYGSKFGSASLALSLVISAIINLIYQWLLMEKALPYAIEHAFKRRLMIIILCWVLFSILVPETISILFKLFVWLFLLIFITMIGIVNNCGLKRNDLSSDATI